MECFCYYKLGFSFKFCAVSVIVWGPADCSVANSKEVFVLALSFNLDLRTGKTFKTLHPFVVKDFELGFFVKPASCQFVVSPV